MKPLWFPALSVALFAYAHTASADTITVPPGGTINGAQFRPFTPQGTGTGVFNPFLRVHNDQAPGKGNGFQDGYNTDFRGKGFADFDQNTSPNFTHSVQLKD